MPIDLVTGLPGHGKTAYTLFRWRAEAEKARRPVFFYGIKACNIPGWQHWEVAEWEKLPAGAIFIVDEAQFPFKVTGRGMTPEWVQNLATHRHRGVDLVLITQDPMLLDPFPRKLVDRHFHVQRRWGTRFARICEFSGGVRDNVAKSTKGAIVHEWRYPAEVFSWYQSTELDTVKARLPARLWLMLAAFLVFIVLGVVAVRKLRPSAVAEATFAKSPESGGAVVGGVSGPSAGGGGGSAPLSPAEYASRYQPRIPGLPHTAPVYDKVTEATQAPYPAACLASKLRCQCYSQQATRIDAPDKLCRDIAAGGFFVAWNLPVAAAVPVQSAQPVAVAPTPVERLAPVYLRAGGAPAAAASAPVADVEVRPVVRPSSRPFPPPGFGQAVGPT